MKKKKNRNIEIFSLSALDLFASAMGAFILLSVMLFPYYNKGKGFERQIGSLEPVAAVAAENAKSAIELLEAKTAALAPEQAPDLPDLSGPRQALVAAQQRKRALESRVEELQKQVAAAEKAAADAEKAAAVAPVPKPSTRLKVTFRFLGLKTSADNFLILVDGAGRIRRDADNLPAILREIVGVMGEGKKFAVLVYNFDDGKANFARFPDSGFKDGSTASIRDAIEFLRKEYQGFRGGSATYQALKRAVAEPDAEAVILVSDGFVLQSHNEGRDWQTVAAEISRANAKRLEIHAVGVGNFYRSKTFWSFLNELRKNNRGDIKVVMPL